MRIRPRRRIAAVLAALLVMQSLAGVMNAWADENVLTGKGRTSLIENTGGGGSLSAPQNAGSSTESVSESQGTLPGLVSEASGKPETLPGIVPDEPDNSGTSGTLPGIVPNEPDNSGTSGTLPGIVPDEPDNSGTSGTLPGIVPDEPDDSGTSGTLPGIVPDEPEDSDTSGTLPGLLPDGPEKLQDMIATPSNAEKVSVMKAKKGADVVRTGSLKIEMNGVVPSKESQWDIELFPTEEEDSEDGDGPVEITGKSICLPAIEVENRRPDIDYELVEAGILEDESDDELETGQSLYQYVQASTTITDILPGTYQLRLVPDTAFSDSSYLPYEQEITIGANQTTIRLMNDDPKKHGYGANASKFGILSMGDIDGNETLDKEDKMALLDIIAKDMMQDSALYDRADLNGDGLVDLLDVVAFARYFNAGLAKQKAEKVTTVLIYPDEILASPSNATRKPESASVEEVFAGTAEAALGLEANEPISEASPVEIAAEFIEAKPMEGLVLDPVQGSDGSIQDGEIIVTVDGEEKERVFTIKDGKVTKAAPVIRRATESNARKKQIYTVKSPALKRIAAPDAANGEKELQEEPEQTMDRGVPIVIDLGSQVPVKKITIRVTKTIKNPKLVEISKVEFYSDMKDRIPEPEMAVPEILDVDNGSEEFTLYWKGMPNVTGYQVEVTGATDKAEKATYTFTVETNSLTVSGLDGGKLIDNTDYDVSVRSVNRDWRSDAAEIKARPVPSSKPPAPENIVISPGYRTLKISWKKMKSTESYTLYYRSTEAEGQEFDAVEDITENSYTLEKLKEDTEYEIYLTGTNSKGTGPESLHYKARTTTMNPPETPNYKLINVLEEGEEITAHIESVDNGTGQAEEFAVVDGRYDTYWLLDDWDAGFYYGQKAPKVTFDQVYKMDTVVLIPDENQPYSLASGKINYVDEGGKEHTAPARMTRKTSNGKYYYMFHMLEPIEAKSVQVAVYTYGSARRIGIAELKFYDYDPIEGEIMGLYEDTFHVSLKPEVTQTMIDDLRERLKKTDPVSGELHPRKPELEQELDNAEQILKEGAQADIIKIDNKDTVKSDGYITFKGGLNTYQPLGVTALKGETLTVYVGGPNHRDGDNTRLELFSSQYHGSSVAVFKSMGYLKAGANEITIEAMDQMDEERGGQLYVEYTGDSGVEEYAVRVSGGHKSAFLDLSDETEHDKKVTLAREYLVKLQEQNEQCQELHAKDHNSFDYDPKNCIYQATDIVTRYNMVSTAAQQVLSGLEEKAGNSIEAMAEQLVNSMDALDEMMVLFYHHKGLSEAGDAPAHNKMPVSRINIRYQRMFAGAFMYAGGKHIGIEWPELKGLMGGEPVAADGDGRYISGGYFGWGIAHEVGHEINESAYAVAEVTNNYFSVLAQAKDDNESVRFKYDDVFAKVTSGTRGKASNVFVQLAMYWQLHLAYDLGGYNYKIYATNQEQLENLIFARMDSYARNLKEAPEGLDLTGANTDNQLMRLAIAASEKNLLEFFRRWGLEPDAGTVQYAESFPEEKRGIWFANDENRAAQIESGGYNNQAEGAEISGSVGSPDNNKVTLSLSSDSDIWMYEIYRYERVKSGIERRPVGYAYAENGAAEFTDVIGTVNNRAFTYEAVGYDQWLNPTARTEIGTVKVSHDGLIDKTLWTVDTNLTNDDYEKPNEEHPDTWKQPGVEDMVDGNKNTVFEGSTASGTDPEIVLNLGKEETITGVAYAVGENAALSDLKVYVSSTGFGDWIEVKLSGAVQRNDGYQVRYFNDGTNLFTYDAAYVRLVVNEGGGKPLQIAELSLLGQTGDNVELDQQGIGLLAQEYSDGTTVIPAGSLIFSGTYKGNPAYNAVLLWDENDEIVGGTSADGDTLAEQIIFAKVPEQGKLGEVSDGRWVYYIDKSYVDTVKSKKVRAELYRVDVAETNEGERLVSSTEFVEIPEPLPSITLNTAEGQ